jgi:hypothetical protein
MSAYRSQLSISFLFPTRPAAEVTAGDLLHLGSLTFVLVRAAVTTDGWVHLTLYDPDRPGSGPHLSYRPDHDLRIAHRGIHPPDPTTDQGWELLTGPAAVPPAPHSALGAERGGDEAGGEFIDMDRVAALIRAAGIACVIDVTDPRLGVALLVGPPTASPAWAHPWSAYAGPAVHAPDGATYATAGTLAVGLHDGGEAEPIVAESVGATTAEQIADLIIAQGRKPHAPLTDHELLAINLHPRHPA